MRVIVCGHDRVWRPSSRTARRRGSCSRDSRTQEVRDRAEEKRTPPRVHVYAQGAHHADVLRIGDRAELHALYQADVSVLRGGRGHSIVFSADGEGFGVHGVLLEAEDGRWDRLPPNDRRPDAVHPWEIVREAAQRTTSP